MAPTAAGKLQKRLEGVQVILVTPFNEEGNPHIDGIRQLTRCLVDRGIREGTGVLVTLGSMSECFSVDLEERKEIIRAVVEEAGGQVPVVVGCNGTDTRTVIRLCESAQKDGADGVLVMPPYYFVPSNQEILQFYSPGPGGQVDSSQRRGTALGAAGDSGWIQRILYSSREFRTRAGLAVVASV